MAGFGWKWPVGERGKEEEEEEEEKETDAFCALKYLSANAPCSLHFSSLYLLSHYNFPTTINIPTAVTTPFAVIFQICTANEKSTPHKSPIKPTTQHDNTSPSTKFQYSLSEGREALLHLGCRT
jgi:hypothetical protein